MTWIVFEGGEGGGKSTQARRLSAWLADEGKTVIMTREPGGTAIGERIRSLLVSGDAEALSPEAEVLLLFAARLEGWRRILSPALDRKDWIISDRYLDSTIAYQGYGHGVSLDKIQAMVQLWLPNTLPDRIYVLDCPVDTGLKRSWNRLAASQPDLKTECRFERLDPSFHERVRQGFLDQARRDPLRYCLISGDRDEDSVFNEIILDLKGRNLLHSH